MSYNQDRASKILSEYNMGQLSRSEALRAMDGLGCLEYYKGDDCNCEGCENARWGVKQIKKKKKETMK